MFVTNSTASVPFGSLKGWGPGPPLVSTVRRRTPRRSWDCPGLLPCGLLHGSCSSLHFGVGCLRPCCPRRRQLYQIFGSRGPRALQLPPLPLCPPPPHLPHFLIRGQSQPCGRVSIPPPHGARAIRRAALPGWYLHPPLAPDTLSPAPTALTLKEKHIVLPSSCLRLLPVLWSISLRWTDATLGPCLLPSWQIVGPSNNCNQRFRSHHPPIASNHTEIQKITQESI